MGDDFQHVACGYDGRLAAALAFAVVGPGAQGFGGVYELHSVRGHLVGHHVAAFGTAAGHADERARFGVDAHGIAAVVKVATRGAPLAAALQHQPRGVGVVAHRVG